VLECSNCGYTLFPAAGREFKFFGDDFKCPQCGSSKEAFKDVADEE
jgi:rubredoxin